MDNYRQQNRISKNAKKQGEMPLPSLSPIHLKNVEFRDGWDRSWVLAFPVVSCFSEGVEFDRPSLDPCLHYSEKIYAACL